MPAPLSLAALSQVKLVLTLLTCAWLSVEQRLGATWSRKARWVLLLLAAVSVSAYFEFFHFKSPQLVHRHEQFHYYLGSKFAPELGYKLLYRCVAVADAEQGNRAGVESRRMRNLLDDSVVWARTALEAPESCRRRFSPERWAQFRSDVTWFRAEAGSEKRWNKMQLDHGYNPSPVWTALGRPLASLSPPGPIFCHVLAWIDVLLMASAIALFTWAFGARVALVATLFWALQAPADLRWTGGSFLRQDWLFLAAAALAFLRKRYWFWAGFTLTYSGLLRVFPALLWAGPVVLMLRHWVHHRRVHESTPRLLAGALVAVALLVPCGAAVAGNSAYAEFIDHIVMRSSRQINNHMSLRSVLSYDVSDARLRRDRGAQDPEVAWKEARAQRLQNRWPELVALAGLLSGLTFWTLWNVRTPWLAVGLAVPLIPVLTDPSCYYFSVFLLAIPLCRARRSLELAYVGLAGIGQSLILQVPKVDARYAALSALYLAFAAVLVLLFARRPRKGLVDAFTRRGKVRP